MVEERRTLKNRKRPKFELDEEVSENFRPNFEVNVKLIDFIYSFFLYILYRFAKFIYCLIFY